MGEKKVLDLQAQNYVLMMSTYIYSFKVIKCGSQLLIYMTTHLFPPYNFQTMEMDIYSLLPT